MVHKDDGILREHGLAEVVHGHVPVILAEALAHHGLGLGAKHQLPARHPCRHTLGHIIHRGAQTPGGNHHIRPGQRQAIGLLQALIIISHHGLVVLADPHGAEPAGQKLRVGIEHLPHQELGAHTENFGNHAMALFHPVRRGMALRRRTYYTTICPRAQSALCGSSQNDKKIAAPSLKIHLHGIY